MDNIFGALLHLMSHYNEIYRAYAHIYDLIPESFSYKLVYNSGVYKGFSDFFQPIIDTLLLVMCPDLIVKM